MLSWWPSSTLWPIKWTDIHCCSSLAGWPINEIDQCDIWNVYCCPTLTKWPIIKLTDMTLRILHLNLITYNVTEKELCKSCRQLVILKLIGILIGKTVSYFVYAQQLIAIIVICCSYWNGQWIHYANKTIFFNAMVLKLIGPNRQNGFIFCITPRRSDKLLDNVLFTVGEELCCLDDVKMRVLFIPYWKAFSHN